MSLNLDNFIPSTAGTFLPQRATREDAPGRVIQRITNYAAFQHNARADTERTPSVPQTAEAQWLPADCFAMTWGWPTMIRLLPRTSDGVAGPRLQSLDLRL